MFVCLCVLKRLAAACSAAAAAASTSSIDSRSSSPFCAVDSWWPGGGLQVAHRLPYAGGSGRGVVRGAGSAIHRCGCTMHMSMSVCMCCVQRLALSAAFCCVISWGLQHHAEVGCTCTYACMCVRYSVQLPLCSNYAPLLTL
jgi:hypothetical protein